MSTHESHADLEAARQIDQGAHESEAFERSDAAKVAAVAAVLASPEPFPKPIGSGWQMCVDAIRTALADPDAALERVRAEARAEALRDAADRMPAFHDRNVPEWANTSACRWLRERADEVGS